MRRLHPEVQPLSLLYTTCGKKGPPFAYILFTKKLVPLSHYTALLKSKLTVTPDSILQTQDLILDS